VSALRSLAGAVLWRVGAAALAFAAGAWAGHEWGARAAGAAHADQLRRVSELYLRAVDDGATRVEHLQEQLTQSQTFASELAQRSRDVPTLARARRPPAAPGATHPGQAGAVAPEPGAGQCQHGGPGELAQAPAATVAAAAALPADGAAAPAGSGADDPGAGGPALTAGAVSLWNSALAGAFVPTGACSLADPTSAACAVDTGTSLRDAWDNQAANAAACRGNSAQLAALIDYLRERERAWPAGGPAGSND
jgi:hypothetical protein